MPRSLGIKMATIHGSRGLVVDLNFFVLADIGEHVVYPNPAWQNACTGSHKIARKNNQCSAKKLEIARDRTARTRALDRQSLGNLNILEKLMLFMMLSLSIGWVAVKEFGLSYHNMDIHSK